MRLSQRALARWPPRHHCPPQHQQYGRESNPEGQAPPERCRGGCRGSGDLERLGLPLFLRSRLLGFRAQGLQLPAQEVDPGALLVAFFLHPLSFGLDLCGLRGVAPCGNLRRGNLGLELIAARHEFGLLQYQGIQFGLPRRLQLLVHLLLLLVAGDFLHQLGKLTTEEVPAARLQPLGLLDFVKGLELSAPGALEGNLRVGMLLPQLMLLRLASRLCGFQFGEPCLQCGLGPCRAPWPRPRARACSSWIGAAAAAAAATTGAARGAGPGANPGASAGGRQCTRRTTTALATRAAASTAGASSHGSGTSAVPYDTIGAIGGGPRGAPGPHWETIGSISSSKTPPVSVGAPS
mmetsp:Transcript_71820/g.181208  ORF Transcript_71820/g.181208 Transcript_71820/m.181208 type:complete len:350 (+) Transcript_71820:660-1709(+)